MAALIIAGDNLQFKKGLHNAALFVQKQIKRRNNNESKRDQNKQNKYSE